MEMLEKHAVGLNFTLAPMASADLKMDSSKEALGDRSGLASQVRSFINIFLAFANFNIHLLHLQQKSTHNIL